MPVITIFGSSSINKNSDEYNNAVNAGKLLAASGFHLATGAYGGIMEAVLEGAENFDIRRIGITLRHSEGREKNRYVNEEIRRDTYLDRLSKLIDIGDGFIIFPGGRGTLLEIAAVLALSQRGIIKKPIICVGKQWQELNSIMNKYSDKINHSEQIILYVQGAEEAVKYIKDYFEEQV
jgi:uncharacterized protein (TIGR00730 family)